MYSSFERSINARKQLRGKDGRWIYEGGSVKWFDAIKGIFNSGVVKGFSGDYVNIESSGGGTSKVHRSRITAIPKKATLGGDGYNKADFDAAPVGSKATIPVPAQKGGSGAKTITVEKQKDGNWFETGFSDGVGKTYSPDQLVGEKASITESASDDSETSGPKDISSWKKGANLGGSNGAAVYTDEEGNQYAVKFLKSDDHAKNEVLASRLYDLAGTPTPGQELVSKDGKIGIASPMVPGVQGDLKQKLQDEDYLNKIREDFAVDAWLANWDVAGLTYDNIITDENGDPIRIDPGGALLYRAQGSPKGDLFDGSADEWDSLRTSSQGKNVFGKMTDEQANESAKKLQSISDEDIDEIVDSVDFDEATSTKLKETLKARRDDVLKRAGLEKSGESTLKPKAELPSEPEKSEAPAQPFSDKEAMLEHLNKVGIDNYINSVVEDYEPVPVGFWKTRKGQIGDVYTPHTDQDKYKILLRQLPNKNGDFWEVIDEDGNISKTTVSHANQSLLRPNVIPNTEQAPEADTEAPASVFEVLPADQRGASGDGYHESGPWGKFGASGVMIYAEDTGKFYIVQRGGNVSSNKGKWQLPGGAMEEKENAYQGAARELIEETSFSEDQLKDLTHAGDVVFDNGKGWTYTNIGATIPNQVDIDVDPQESSAGEWVTAEELLDMRDAGELVPSFGKNVKDIIQMFGSNEKEKTVDVSDEDAVDISLEPATNVQGIGGKSVGKGIPTSDNGQGIVSHDNSQVSLSGVPKGQMTYSEMDIQSAGIGQKVYDPVFNLEFERKDVDTWEDTNGMKYTVSQMSSLAKADGFIWGSKEDYESGAGMPEATPDAAPAGKVPDKDKEYEWSEVNQLVADFYDNADPGSDDDIVNYKLADGTRLMLSKTGDEDADGIEVLPVGLAPNATNWKGPINWREALQSKDISEEIEDLAFGGSASDPDKEPRLSTGAADLNSLPEGSVVKFGDASDSKVYLKNADGSWSASWLDDDHPQKNVTSDQIHAVAAYLGKDVQVMKEDGEPNPQSAPEEPELAEWEKELLAGYPLADFEVGDFFYTDKNTVYTKESGGNWSGEDVVSGTKISMTEDEVVQLINSNKITPEKNVVKNVSAPETKIENSELLEKLGLGPDEEIGDFLAEAPVGTEITFKKDVPGVSAISSTLIKGDNDGIWNDKYSGEEWDEITFSGSFDSNNIVDFIEGNGEEEDFDLPEPKAERTPTPATAPEPQSAVEKYGVTEANLIQKYNEFPEGTQIDYQTGVGNKYSFVKESDGNWHNTENGSLVWDSVQLEDKYYASEITNITVPEHPQQNLLNKLMNLGDTPDIASTVDGINYDSSGNAWVPDKNGKALRVGSIVTSKAGEKGKIDYIQKGGQKVRVKTEDGNTKFWMAHLVEKAGPEVTYDDSNNKYVIHEDDEGNQYLISPDGDNIYVGDTVVSSGKTGFEGEVVGFKSGEFVLVKDPSDGKVKPRKIDKIKLVSSAKPAPAPEAKPAAVTPVPGEKVTSVDELDAAPAGTSVTLTENNPTGIFFRKNTDGKWYTTINGNRTEGGDLDSSAFQNPVNDGNLYWFDPDATAVPSAPEAPTSEKGVGDVFESAEDLDNLPVGTVISIPDFTKSKWLFEKNDEGNWIDVTDPNDKGTHQYESKAFKKNFADKDGIIESIPGQDAEPDTGLKPGDNLKGMTKEEFDALPVGFQVELDDPKYVYTKEDDGKWHTTLDNGNKVSSANNMVWGVAQAGNLTVPVEATPSPESEEKKDQAGTAVAPTYEEFMKLPVGSVMYHVDAPENTFTKIADNHWELFEPKFGTSKLKFDDSDFEVEIETNSMLWHEKSPNVAGSTPQAASASDWDNWKDGDIPTNVTAEMVEALPGGATFLRLPNGNFLWRKNDDGTWTRINVKTGSTSGIGFSNEKIAEFFQEGSLQVHKPEAEATAQPAQPSLPGKNGKNVAVGATVSYNTPQKSKKGKVIEMDTANGDVIFVDDATGKKAKHKAKFLTVEEEAPATSQPAPQTTPTPAPQAAPTLTKDPSSPWYEQPEPEAPGEPTGLRKDFAMDGLYEELNEGYKTDKGKEFANSSYHPLFEQLSKNGSLTIPGNFNKNEAKYGAQDDLLDFFRARGYISQETADNARAHFNQVDAHNATLLKDHADKVSKYTQDLLDWKIANGVPLSGFYSATFQPSTDADEILKKMGNKKFSGVSAADANIPYKPNKKDRNALLTWKGSSNPSTPGDPDYVPSISWAGLSVALRQGGESKLHDISGFSQDQQKVIKALDDAIDASELTEELIVTRTGSFRNFTLPNGKEAKTSADIKAFEGAIITDYGFVAGSPGASAGYASSHEVDIRIRMPKGSKGAWLGGKNGINVSEREILLPRGSRFYVHEMRPGTYGDRPQLIVDLVPADWTPAAGQTTQAVNPSDPNAPSVGGPTVPPTQAPDAPAASV